MSFRRSVLGSGTLDTLISSSKVAVSIPILLTAIRTSWNGQAKGSVNSRNLYTSNIRNGRSRNGLTQSCTTTTGDVLGTFIGQNVRRSDHLTSRTKYDNASIAAQPSLQAQVALIERAMDAETSSLYATRLSRDAYTYGKYNKNPTTRDAVKYGYAPLPPIIHRQQIFRHEIHSKMPVLLEESTFKGVSLATLAAFLDCFEG